MCKWQGESSFSFIEMYKFYVMIDFFKYRIELTGH